MLSRLSRLITIGARNASIVIKPSEGHLGCQASTFLQFNENRPQGRTAAAIGLSTSSDGYQKEVRHNLLEFAIKSVDLFDSESWLQTVARTPDTGSEFVVEDSEVIAPGG